MYTLKWVHQNFSGLEKPTIYIVHMNLNLWISETPMSNLMDYISNISVIIYFWPLYQLSEQN